MNELVHNIVNMYNKFCDLQSIHANLFIYKYLHLYITFFLHITYIFLLAFYKAKILPKGFFIMNSEFNIYYNKKKIITKENRLLKKY